MKLSLFLSSLLLLGAQTVGAAESSGTSSSVRPPDFQWWRDGRFGMFIHWGPAALTGKEISWTRKSTGIEKYDALYKEFNPVNFNATEWVATAKAAGMKYMVLTAKHHDGFMLWDTKTGDYNIMHTPFGRDVVAELAAAAKKAALPFCVYFSPGDWKDPDCRNPATNAKFVGIGNGWIEVDLESPTSVTRARIHEYGGFVPVSSWKIEYHADGEWRKAAEGTTIGKRLDVSFPAPVTARKFRILIEADGRPALSEFLLF